MLGAGKDMLLSVVSPGLEGFTPSDDMLICKAFPVIKYIEKQEVL